MAKFDNSIHFDHVGSFLRPQALKEAKKLFKDNSSFQDRKQP